MECSRLVVLALPLAGVPLIGGCGPGSSKPLQIDDLVAQSTATARASMAPRVTSKPTPNAAPKLTTKPAVKATPRPTLKAANVYYANCTAARNAGAAPIHRGEPGYRPALDRDNDGIACE